MPSFWEHTRLDVLHVPGVATRVSTRSIAITCAPTSLAAPTAAAALPRSSLLPYIPQSKEQDRTTPTAHQKKRHTETRAATSQCASDVHYLPSCPCAKAGHLNRPQCKVMTSNVIRTSVEEGVQPRERRSHPAEHRSTS